MLASTSHSQVVGTVDANGIPSFTLSNPTELLASWNNLIQTGTGIDPGLNNLVIRRRGGDYRLFAYGSEYKSSTLLTLNQSTNELSIAAPGGIKTTCTTKACATNTGCEVQTDVACSSGSIHGRNGDCTKSTTTSNWCF
ncbi:MAG: hypothetical protein JST27_06180 [Bacteroidetes bacterium]|nr:hypothetical protein [Bacteroidota bacterium]